MQKIFNRIQLRELSEKIHSEIEASANFTVNNSRRNKRIIAKREARKEEMQRKFKSSFVVPKNIGTKEQRRKQKSRSGDILQNMQIDKAEKKSQLADEMYNDNPKGVKVHLDLI